MFKVLSTDVRITQTARVSARAALSATVTFNSIICIVLHRCSELTYRTTSRRCSVSHTHLPLNWSGGNTHFWQ